MFSDNSNPFEGIRHSPRKISAEKRERFHELQHALFRWKFQECQSSSRSFLLVSISYMKNSSRVSANRNALLELRDRVEGKNISVGFQWLSLDRAWKPVYPKLNQYIGSSRSQRIVYDADNGLWVFTRRENAITRRPRGEEALENVFSIVCSTTVCGYFTRHRESPCNLYLRYFLDYGDTTGRTARVCIVLRCLLGE